MTQNDLISLSDVYEELCEDKLKKTTYILQFLWWDVSSKFDLIGPYFTSESGLDARFTIACLFEVLRALECVGFNVIGLVCDVASSNLTVLKKLWGSIWSWFILCWSFLGHSTDTVVWYIACPSHQVSILCVNVHNILDPIIVQKSCS